MLNNLLRHRLGNRLVKDTLILFGVQISGYVLPLVTLPYLTRVLGPANFGLTALGTALALYFVVLTDWGFPITGTRQMAIVQDQPEKVWRTYSTIMACKLALLGVCFLVMAALVASIPKLRAFWPLYAVSFLQVIGACLSPNWVLQGMQKMRYIAYSDYGAKVISVILIFALVHRSSDYMIVAALQSGGFLVAALLGLTVVFRKLNMRIVRPTIADMRQSYLDGWPVFLSTASMTAMSSTNTMIVGGMASASSVGYLSAAQRLIVAARSLTNPITGAIYPHVSRMAARSPQEALRFVRKQIFLTSLPFLAVTIGMLTLAPYVVFRLYGPKFTETGLLLQIMSLTPVLHAVASCFGTYFMLAFGFQKEWSKIITRMVILNFVLVFALVNFMQADRAIALTTVLCDLFSAGSSYLFYRKTSRIMLEQKPVMAAEAV